MTYNVEENNAPIVNISGVIENPESVLRFNYIDELKSAFATPALGERTTVCVLDSSKYKVGGFIIIGSSTIVKIVGILSINKMLVSGIVGSPGASNALGSPIATCANPELWEATASSSGALVDHLAEPLTAPGVGSSAYIKVISGGWAAIDSHIFVQGLGVFRVTALDPVDSTRMQVKHDAPDANYAKITASSGTAPAGTAIFPVAVPEYRMATFTMRVLNATNKPGEALTSVGLNVPITKGTSRRIVTGVTSAETVPVCLDREKEVGERDCFRIYNYNVISFFFR